MADKRQHASCASPIVPEKLRPKRSKPSSSSLCDLPNELLLDILGYLKHVDVFDIFSALTPRLQALIHSHCTTLDFTSVTKPRLEHIIRVRNTHQWRALRLSNDGHTPGQVAFFFEHYPFATHVPELEVLSLTNMKFNFTQTILPQLRVCTRLVSLTLETICGRQMPSLELPCLRKLTVTSCKCNRWMQNLSELKSLEYVIVHDHFHENYLVWPAQLERLRVAFSEPGDSECVQVALSQLPQLRSLAIYDDSRSLSAPNGDRWEQLIVSALPSLAEFQFYFKFCYDVLLNTDLSSVVASFSTPFYVNEKHWTVQCDVHQPQFRAAILYSIPFAFERFEMLTRSVTRRTQTADDCHTSKRQSYKHLRTLVVSANYNEPKPELLHAGLQHLVLRCSDTPADWLFSTMGVRQLSLSNQTELSTEDFSRLIHAMPRLDSLNVSYAMLTTLTSNWTNETICKRLGSKIRSLNLCFNEYLSPGTRSPWNNVSAEECPFIASTFSDNCEHLTISVSTWSVVFNWILGAMQRLHSLKVYVREQSNLVVTKEWIVKNDPSCKTDESFIRMDENEYTFWFHC